jgi:DNA-binding response OmpR family regulator
MRMLVVDDDPILLDALSIGFQLQWQDIELLTCTSGDRALRIFEERDPDLVLLDVGLPGSSGFEVLREIRRVSDVPVIMLTGHGAEMDQVHGLELGADDYVSKPFGQQALIARIKALLRRAELPAPMRAAADFSSGGLAIHFDSHQAFLDGEPVRLTPVEFRLLYQLARNVGRIIPQRALLDRVWGSDYEASPDQLKVMVSRLRSKIEKGGHRFIETHRGLGYRFVRAPAADVAAS